MVNGVRFIIVSRDTAFNMEVKKGLELHKDIDMIVNVASQADAENKISRNVPTTILFDLDTVTIYSSLLNKMVSRFSNVLVVLTSIRESTARRYMTDSIRDFAFKPPIINKMSITRYLRLIMERTSGVKSAMGSDINFKDITKIVGTSDIIVATASSTGGVEALEQVISFLPADIPPILAVQHMPSGFTKLFAERLNGMYPQDIREAKSGDVPMRGRILIAPAGHHMVLIKKNGRLMVDCYMGPKMHGVIPAADILFESVANIMKSNAVGVVLTGMGSDGGRGLMLMHNNGAKTIIQNEETCVVYGMPKVAKDLGAADYELPLDRIAERIMGFA